MIFNAWISYYNTLMPKINVASPVKLDEICEFLESQTDVTYKYVCNITRYEITYEVTDTDGTHGDLSDHTKRLIRSLPYGKVIMFRVLYDGQIFEYGKIYQPGDPEYDALHAHVTYRNS